MLEEEPLDLVDPTVWINHSALLLEEPTRVRQRQRCRR